MSRFGHFIKGLSFLGLLLAAAGGGWYLSKFSKADKAAENAHAHGEHDHDHPGHDDGDTLQLSPQALLNIGLQTMKVELKPHQRTVTIPAMIVQQPGRTSARVVAPLTGVITRVYALAGEVLTPGNPLFDLRLTHEDLVQSQVEFLKNLEERDVVQRELTRIGPLIDKGVLPRRTAVDRQYEFDKLDALHKAQRQALLLHGLSDLQIDEIMKTRHLLSTLTVAVPRLEATAPPKSLVVPAAAAAPLPPPTDGRLVEELKVHPGQLVTAGDTLCTLADLSNLYIEGRGFEQDAPRILEVVKNDWKITGLLDVPGEQKLKKDNEDKPEDTSEESDDTATLKGLSILYIADKVDAESRTFAFFLHLKNEVLRDTIVDGHRFVNWRFKPGQRVQLKVPIQKWQNQIVVPVSAITQDGVETYVFVSFNKKFTRRPVHVAYRDRTSAVILNDGSLFRNETIAATGAAQMQMALKNKVAGPIDPHAGHNH